MKVMLFLKSIVVSWMYVLTLYALYQGMYTDAMAVGFTSTTLTLLIYQEYKDAESD